MIFKEGKGLMDGKGRRPFYLGRKGSWINLSHNPSRRVTVAECHIQSQQSNHKPRGNYQVIDESHKPQSAKQRQGVLSVAGLQPHVLISDTSESRRHGSEYKSRGLGSAAVN
jgi:hypothetical protein